MVLQEIRNFLIEDVDGFEPMEEVSDQIWDINKSMEDMPEKEVANVTPLFKE
jgi:hypothetical protein